MRGQDQRGLRNDLFVKTVARNRGLDEPQVRSTEAGRFFGDGAVKAAMGVASQLVQIESFLITLCIEHKVNRAESPFRFGFKASRPNLRSSL